MPYMKQYLLYLILTPLMLTSAACSLSQKETNRPISLRFEGVKGHKDLYSIHSQTVVENISPDKLLHQKIDMVEFDVQTEISKIDSKNSTIEVNSKTIKKEGHLSLHDMAYPELNETIHFVFDRQGRVLRAGDHPSDTIFYIPPLPLPETEVKVGDTWTYEKEWRTQQSLVPMKLQLVMVLKKVINCYRNEKCVEIEWSGKVSPADEGLPIESLIVGYTLYRPKTASQIWTWSRNEEKLKLQGVDMKVSTCVHSILKSERSKINPFAKQEPLCDPTKARFSLARPK